VNPSGLVAPSGQLTARLIRDHSAIARALYPPRELTVAEIARHGLPRRGLPAEVNAWRTSNAKNLWRGARRALTARRLGLSNVYGSLYATLYRGNGEVLELGLASMRVVTTAGVNFLVDAFQGTVEPEILKYHGVGTGATAEASGDTALVTESTTILTVDSTRATGSLTEGASANIFRTVGTVSFDGSGAITEHGIFSQAATGGGTLWDRSVFAAINVVSTDSIAFTYDATFAAGS
jgi:hypothetical protein